MGETVRYRIITKVRYKGVIYTEGELLPEDFVAPESWLTNGVIIPVEKIEKPKKKREVTEDGS